MITAFGVTKTKACRSLRSLQTFLFPSAYASKLSTRQQKEKPAPPLGVDRLLFVGVAGLPVR